MARNAFLIGANTLGLQYSEKDAELLYELFSSFDYNVSIGKGSKHLILESFEEFADKCGKVDSLIFYFSGHGQIIRGELYLRINENNEINKSCINIKTIIDIILNSKSKEKIFILDCCNSGQSAQDLPLTEPGGNFRLLTSSKRLEVSKEIQEYKSSFMTYWIFKGLSENTVHFSDGENELRINEFYVWLRKQALAYNSMGINQVSIPNLFGNNDANIVLIEKPSLQKIQRTSSKIESPISRIKQIEIGKLPSISSNLFGRSKELKAISEYWEKDSANILVIVAWGGVGKTALINNWLVRMAEQNYRNANVVYAWSFYNQGITNRLVSSDLFIETALRYFGDVNPAHGTASEKALRLAERIRLNRTLLILDGIEPLQYPFGINGGKFKDNAMKVLLKDLASQNNGLCIISSRLQLEDIESYKNFSVKYINLDYLSPNAGALILKEQGVKGNNQDLEEISKQFKGHSLTLKLLGSYISDVCDGDITKFKKIQKLKANIKLNSDAFKVLNAYETWFGESPELSVLRILGLFDRPITTEVFTILKTPPINELSTSLFSQTHDGWKKTIKNLRNIGLLFDYDPNNPDVLDLHPIIREYFCERLKTDNPKVWEEANNRLFNFYRSNHVEYPSNIDEMEPLFLSVIYACKAKKFKEALNDIYFPKIMRYEEYFASAKLGAFSTLLYVLSHFFNDGNWEIPYEEIEMEDLFIIYREVGQYLTSTRGYADGDVGKCYEYAKEISDNLDNFQYKIETLLGQIKYYRMHGQVNMSGKISQNLLALCQNEKDEIKTLAYRAVATNYYYQGDFVTSLKFSKLGYIKYNDIALALKNAQIDVNEPSLSCLGYIALNSWFLGDLVTAQKLSKQTVIKSEILDHKHTLVVAIYIETLVYQYSNDKEKTQNLAKRLRDTSAEFGFTLWNIAGEILFGWSSDDEKAIAVIENSLFKWESTGARLFSHYWRALLAEKYFDFGYYETAIQHADIGINVSEATNDKHWQSELYRIKSLALYKIGQPIIALDNINKSLYIAKKQKSILLEVRSLCDKYFISNIALDKQEITSNLITTIKKVKTKTQTKDLIRATQILEQHGL